MSLGWFASDLARSARAEEVLDRQLIETRESATPGARRLDVEALVGVEVGASVAASSPSARVGTESSSTWLAARASRTSGSCAERSGPLLQEQVGRMFEAAASHTPAMSSVRSGLKSKCRGPVVGGPPPGPPFSSRSTRKNALTRSPWPKTRSWSNLSPAGR